VPLPTSGSQLDGRAKKGWWIGFDQESKGHRIYWPEKRSVTVERSVTFIPEEVDVHVGNALVGGEMEDFDEIYSNMLRDTSPFLNQLSSKTSSIHHMIPPLQSKMMKLMP